MATYSILVTASGFCALAYQVAWIRQLWLVFGASTAASAATTAIFVGAMGFGAIVFGRRVDGSRNALRFYGRLELLVAVSAALSPVLFGIARALYVHTGGVLALGEVKATIVRLAASVAALGFPSFCMGGTLPAIARRVESLDDIRRRRLSHLYGANTLGGVIGVLWANFVSLELFGTNATIWIASAVNAVVALAALYLARGAPDTVETKVESKPSVGVSGVQVSLLVAIAAVTGGAFLGMEVVWYRMLAPILGGSVYTFGVVLAVALTGVGSGGIAYAMVDKVHGQRTIEVLAVTCAIEAILLVLPYAIGDRIAILALALRSWASGGLTALVAGWVVVAGIVVLPPAFLSGYQFPLLIRALGSGRLRVGSHVGLIYAANATGSIVGSLSFGLWLIPSLSAPTSWRLAAVLLAALAVVIMITTRSAASSFRIGVSALAVLAVALCAAPGPSAFWRHSSIGAGRAPVSAWDTNSLRAAVNERRAAITWQAEGRESSVALERLDGYSLLVNGKSDGSAISDAPTQVMLGLIPAILHRRPETALVIGLGTGQTAGWLAQVPSIQKVDVLELEPVVAIAAEQFAAVNNDVLASPKVHLIFGDARELVLTLRERYDLVVSEPSNPYRAGVASLFTTEFYEAVSARLKPSGLFAQWVQAYELSPRAVASVLGTLAGPFRFVETWETLVIGDLVLLASNIELQHDVSVIRGRTETEPYRSALAYVWGVSGVEGLYTGFVAAPSFARSVRYDRSAFITSDDRMLLEFSSARDVGRAVTFSTEDLRSSAARADLNRPATMNGDIDWDVVSELRAVRAVTEQQGRFVGSSTESSVSHRLAARGAYGEGNLAQAHAEWVAQNQLPLTPGDQRMVAEFQADAGSPSAVLAIEQLSTWQPAEAEALLGVWHYRRDQPEEAVSYLAKAFISFRQHPWSYRPLFRRTIERLTELVERYPEYSPQLFDSLSEPFAVHSLDRVRLIVRWWLAFRPTLRQRCAEAVLPFEPSPPWTRLYLEDRYRCYGELAHPLLSQARRDLDAFLANQ